MAKKKEMNVKAKKVLESAFDGDVNSYRDQNAREETIQYINSVIRPKNEKLLFKLSVEDVEKKNWRYKEHFTKIFYFELNHVIEYYSLPKGVKNFLLSLGEYLMWQTNLLVDDEDNPLSQKDISALLDINRKTVQRNMKELEDRFIIHKIKILNKNYYIVNPYIMFIGQEINIAIPKLFDDLGYKNSSMSENRSDRKKAQQKRVAIRD